MKAQQSLGTYSENCVPYVPNLHICTLFMIVSVGYQLDRCFFNCVGVLPFSHSMAYPICGGFPAKIVCIAMAMRSHSAHRTVGLRWSKVLGTFRRCIVALDGSFCTPMVLKVIIPIHDLHQSVDSP